MDHLCLPWNAHDLLLQDTALCYMCCMPLEQHLWTAYLPLLDIDTLMGSDSLTLSTQLFMVPWVIEAVSFNVGQTIETSLLKWKWYLQDRYKHAKRGGLPCLKSLVRCHSAGGDHPYSWFLDYLGNLLGSTEWTAKGVHTFYRVQCHCDT